MLNLYKCIIEKIEDKIIYKNISNIISLHLQITLELIDQEIVKVRIGTEMMNLIREEIRARDLSIKMLSKTIITVYHLTKAT